MPDHGNFIESNRPLIASVTALRAAAEALGLRLGVKPAAARASATWSIMPRRRARTTWYSRACGVKVIVDGASLPTIDGTRIDFVRQGLNESFRFENPNVRGECGCGESFTRLKIP